MTSRSDEEHTISKRYMMTLQMLPSAMLLAVSELSFEDSTRVQARQVRLLVPQAECQYAIRRRLPLPFMFRDRYTHSS